VWPLTACAEGPPPELVLDTSLVADALIETSDRHAECDRVLRLLREGGVTTFYLSSLLAAELLQVAHREPLRVFTNKMRPIRRYDRRVLPRVARFAEGVMKSFDDLLDSLDHVVVPMETVLPLVPGIMAHGLESYDAVHAATAAYVGATVVVSRVRAVAEQLGDADLNARLR
jgi:predicted nucleic acid-binding protein